MANFYGAQYTQAFRDVPSSKIAAGDVSGVVKSLYMSFTCPTADELATTDTLYLGVLPAGARVLGGKIKCPATGATGIFNVGYQANGVDAADLDAFVVGADPGAAAVAAEVAGDGVGKKFSAATTVVLTPTEITADMGTKTVQVWLNYSTP
jgi:hypothetical protein